MRRRLMWLALFSAVILVTARCDAGNVHATSPEGFTSTTVARGTLNAIDISNYFAPLKSDASLSLHETRGTSDLYVQNNVWQPGGSTGWHSHPGHSLIIVTAGAVTDYEGHDLDCKPHVYTKGMGFVDPGGDHIHAIRRKARCRRVRERPWRTMAPMVRSACSSAMRT